MSDPQAAYQALEEAIRAWATDEKGVRAVIVVGSRARREPPPDDWSDLDLILFATDPNFFARDASWLGRFGDVWLSVLQEAGAGDPEWLVLFAGGYKVDFLLATAVPNLAEALQGPVFGHVCRRGMRILLDKDGSGIAPVFDRSARHPIPDASRFKTHTDTFWMSAYRAAGMIRRGDLWRARQILDGELRRGLQTMIAWHAQAQGGAKRDTWYDGRFIQDWADPRAVADLAVLFAAFDRASTAQALHLLVRLYAMLAGETAAEWRYPYPTPAANRVRGWIEATLEGSF